MQCEEEIKYYFYLKFYRSEDGSVCNRGICVPSPIVTDKSPSFSTTGRTVACSQSVSQWRLQRKTPSRTAAAALEAVNHRLLLLFGGGGPADSWPGSSRRVVKVAGGVWWPTLRLAAVLLLEGR